jgi:hypothetical protein
MEIFLYSILGEREEKRNYSYYSHNNNFFKNITRLFKIQI